MAHFTLHFKSFIFCVSMLVSSVRSISMLYEQPIGCDIVPGRESGPPLIRSSSKMWLEGYKAGCTQFLQSYIPDHRDGKSLVIGIAGGSGSGKTTIKDVIVEQLSKVRAVQGSPRPPLPVMKSSVFISWAAEESGVRMSEYGPPCIAGRYCRPLPQENVAVLPHDNYYRHRPDLSDEVPVRTILARHGRRGSGALLRAGWAGTPPIRLRRAPQAEWGGQRLRADATAVGRAEREQRRGEPRPGKAPRSGGPTRRGRRGRGAGAFPLRSGRATGARAPPPCR
jgi:hypothetical protein